MDARSGPVPSRRGHGITEALTVLLIYFGLGAVILGLLDWYRPDEAPVPDDVAEGAAMTAAAAAGPP